MKILCVEDDEGLTKLLQRALVKQHYQVECAADGENAWELIEADKYDLILLDWMLPKITGIQLCQKLRSEQHSTLNPNRDTPILLMTALEAVTNRIMGLNAGADDYVVKPFDLDELLARIRALLRRAQGSRSPLFSWGGLCLNPNSCEVTYQGQPIQLAAKEYELLELFLRNPDQIFSLNRLLMNLWIAEEIPSEGAVRAHIKGLRQKLRQAGVADPIETIYKLGYRLRPWQGTESAAAPPLPAPDPPQSSASTLESEIPQVLLDLWQECRQSYYNRLQVIQDAVTSLQQGKLTAAQQHAAEREAHTLIGSLGSFGLDHASQLSRQLQQILKQPTLTSLDLATLTPLIHALQQCLAPSDDEPQPQKQNMVGRPTSSCLMPVLLIVDDDLPLAQGLSKEALSWGLKPEVAVTPQDALRFLQDCPVDAILLDLNFTDSVSHGLELLGTIHQQYPDIPVVVLTAEEKFENRVKAARLGSRCFLQKPISLSQVLAAITQLVPQANQLSTKILVVDDDPALLNLVKTLLEPYGYEVTLLSSPDQFWRSLEQVTPDLLILDVELSHLPKAADLGGLSSSVSSHSADSSPLSGIELCQVIRNDPRWNRLPVLFLSAHTDIATVQRGFAAGGDDFLNKPVIAPELLTRVRIRLEQRKLWGANDLDELTGVSLRRRALQDLTRLIRLAQRQHHAFTLALLDIDHFKQVNDQYGHDVGDQVLHYLGKLLRQSFREEDIVGRWGGEEFIIGMYGITDQDGKDRLEEVLQQLSHYVFLSLDGTGFSVTFSAGVAQLSHNNTGIDELKTLYHFADQALYQAKSAGRNRVFIAKSLSEPGEQFDA